MQRLAEANADGLLSVIRVAIGTVPRASVSRDDKVLPTVNLSSIVSFVYSLGDLKCSIVL